MKLLRLPILSLLLTCIILVATDANGQWQSGMRWDNYQGINAALVNPSNSATQKLPWNLNIASAGAFFQNNYLYYQNAKVSDLWNNELIFREDIGDVEPTDGQTIFDYNNDDSKKWGQLSGFLTGPSFMTHIGNHNFGIFMNYRMHAAEQNLDQDLGYYTNRRLPATEPVNLDAIQMSVAGWREIGVNYSTSFFLDAGILSVGINGKMLTAYDAVSIRTPNSTEITPVSVDEISIDNVYLEGVGTSAIIQGVDFFENSKGGGYGVDIGASFIIEDYDGYLFKFGLAVNDIGKLTFNQDVEAHVFDSNNTSIIDKRNYLQAEDFEALIQEASTDFLGSSTASLEPMITSFDMSLPTTIVLSADYKAMENVFVNAAFFQRLGGKEYHLEASNAIAIVPRYESKWIGVALPVTNVNFEKTTVGLAIRGGFLTIGTDNLGTLFRQNELTGADAYISLQVFPFGDGGGFGGGSRGGRASGCPSSHF